MSDIKDELNPKFTKLHRIYSESYECENSIQPIFSHEEIRALVDGGAIIDLPPWNLHDRGAVQNFYKYVCATVCG